MKKYLSLFLSIYLFISSVSFAVDFDIIDIKLGDTSYEVIAKLKDKGYKYEERSMPVPGSDAFLAQILSDNNYNMIYSDKRERVVIDFYPPPSEQKVGLIFRYLEEKKKDLSPDVLEESLVKKYGKFSLKEKTHPVVTSYYWVFDNNGNMITDKKTINDCFKRLTKKHTENDIRKSTTIQDSTNICGESLRFDVNTASDGYVYYFQSYLVNETKNHENYVNFMEFYKKNKEAADAKRLDDAKKSGAPSL